MMSEPSLATVPHSQATPTIELATESRSTSPVRPYPHRHLDPRQFHGAWIFLCESTAAGALIGESHGVERAMLVGTACSGAFLVFAAVATGMSGKTRQWQMGTCLAIGLSLIALLLQSDARFLCIAGMAAILASVTIVLAKYRGFLSPIVLAMGVGALALTAPASAVAGGANPMRAALLLAMLWALFYWRSLRVASLVADGLPWNTALLRQRGLREAALTAMGTLFIAILLKVTG